MRQVTFSRTYLVMSRPCISARATNLRASDGWIAARDPAGHCLDHTECAVRRRRREATHDRHPALDAGAAVE